jgi:hypothetical protein
MVNVPRESHVLKHYSILQEIGTPILEDIVMITGRAIHNSVLTMHSNEFIKESLEA